MLEYLLFYFTFQRLTRVAAFCSRAHLSAHGLVAAPGDLVEITGRRHKFPAGRAADLFQAVQHCTAETNLAATPLAGPVAREAREKLPLASAAIRPCSPGL